FKNSSIQWLIPAIAIMSAAGALILFNKNHEHREPPVEKDEKKGLAAALKEKFLRLYSAINLYRHRPALLAKTFCLSIFLQGMAIVSSYLFVLSVGADIQFTRMCLMIPLIWTVSMLPSLNGLGVREGAFVYFLKGHIGPEKAFAVSILWLGGVMLNGLVGGILHLLHPVKINNKEVS
ncbi:MAG: lysylphosphatidylglycerol synthase domain-containing protein, partial [Candidatus Omnitrophota bacterium]